MIVKVELSYKKPTVAWRAKDADNMAECKTKGLRTMEVNAVILSP